MVGNDMIKKLKSNRGDSIGEVLVALLVGSFALMIMATMITAAGRMVNVSKAYMDEYYEKSSDMATKIASDGATTETGKMKITSDETQNTSVFLGDDKEVDVDIYTVGEDESKVYWYK